MSRVEALKQGVRALSHEELAAFRAWFASFDAERWDRGIEADFRAGRLDAMASEALQTHHRGESREL